MPIAKTDQLMTDLNEINNRINRLEYTTDLSKYGAIDLWTAKIEEAGSGDCDDYALSKRKLLIEKGYDWKYLHPAICMINRGQDGHLVLLVETDAGTFILDNNTNKIDTWPGSDYKWLQRLDGPRGWVTFD